LRGYVAEGDAPPVAATVAAQILVECAAGYRIGDRVREKSLPVSSISNCVSMA
jgi:hypothetical protein